MTLILASIMASALMLAARHHVNALMQDTVVINVKVRLFGL